MKHVKILGMGCKKCNSLEEKVKEVAKKNNIEISVEKVSALDEISRYNVMMTPALVIDERVKSYGTIPSEENILKWLSE